MNDINIGQSLELDERVTSNQSAISMGSGDLEVFSTPSMIALMEKASMQCIASNLEPEDTSVGGAVNIKHLKATAIGSTVRCKSMVTAWENPKVEFEVNVYQESILIGTGTHTRFVVNRERFMGKL